MNRKAFLFDMDGTMIDSMPYHLRAWQKIVVETGSTKTAKEISGELYGKNTEILTRILGSGKYSPEQIKEMADRKDAYYRDIYGPHAALLPGLKQFFEQARRCGVLLAIASATLDKNVSFIVEALGIDHFFSAIVSGSDVKNSKPDPETFLKAAERLDLLPRDCLVFEDVPKGVEAALRASMCAVAILTTYKPDDFKALPNVVRTIKNYNLLEVREFL